MPNGCMSIYINEETTHKLL